MTEQSSEFVRLDTFRNVPQDGREEFIRRITMTHEVLRLQPGFVRDRLLERIEPNGTSTIVTIAEWATIDAVPGAATAVRSLHEREHFDPRELIERLGIQAEFGQFEPLGVEVAS